MSKPYLSVILPLYNAEAYIANSVQCILDQTWSDFELIIIDDGSSDASASIVENFKDKRIQFYRQENKGLAATLNRGLEIAEGMFIARQDSDDLSYPTRFETQLNFLKENPETGLLGTWSDIIRQDGTKTGRMHRHPAHDRELKYDLFFDNPFVHSSVMFRKSVLAISGNYNTNAHPLVQDYDLWFRISRLSAVANIPEVLHEYREAGGSMSRTAIDFHKVVAEQSLLHMMKVLDPGDLPAAKRLAQCYHGVEDEDVLGEDIVSFNRILNKLEASVNTKDSSHTENLSEKHLKVLKKNINRKLMYGKNTPLLKKIYYRLMNKLLPAV